MPQDTLVSHVSIRHSVPITTLVQEHFPYMYKVIISVKRHKLEAQNMDMFW